MQHILPENLTTFLCMLQYTSILITISVVEYVAFEHSGWHNITHYITFILRISRYSNATYSTSEFQYISVHVATHECSETHLCGRICCVRICWVSEYSYIATHNIFSENLNIFECNTFYIRISISVYVAIHEYSDTHFRARTCCIRIH